MLLHLYDKARTKGTSKQFAKILKYFQISWYNAAALAASTPIPDLCLRSLSQIRIPRSLSQRGLLNVVPGLRLMPILAAKYSNVTPVRLCMCDDRAGKEPFI